MLVRVCWRVCGCGCMGGSEGVCCACVLVLARVLVRVWKRV